MASAGDVSYPETNGTCKVCLEILWCRILCLWATDLVLTVVSENSVTGACLPPPLQTVARTNLTLYSRQGHFLQG